MNKHIIACQQFDKAFINKIFSLADKLSRSKGMPLKGKILATLFYEPSTRTRFSFESAMIRLGGNVVTTENASEFSSATKGETIEDTVRVIGKYADAIVIRHFETGAVERASLVSDVPVINAGDGVGQHPTQALLDLYTIKKEVGRLDRLNVALVGDLKHGRTVRSLAYLLGKYSNNNVYLISPKALRIGDDIKAYFDRHKFDYYESEDLFENLGKFDVLYQTRVQKERFTTPKEYQKYKGVYKIDLSLVERLKKKAIIMHPLPRVDEIDQEVDKTKNAVYFKQVEYGLHIRMALLLHILK